MAGLSGDSRNDACRWRDLLPLPLFDPDGWQDTFQHPERGVTSVGSYRRRVRRFENVQRANGVIEAVNNMSGFSQSKQGSPNVLQQEAMTHTLHTARSRPRASAHISTREAVCELLHSRASSGYFEEEASGTTVRPYQRELVSLPNPGASVMDASVLVDQTGRDILQAYDTSMLRDFEKEPPPHSPDKIKPYMDVQLANSKPLYNQFIRDLWDRNMIEFASSCKCTVTPFFVVKKNGKQRLVLDCRSSNVFFKDPPDIAMPAGYSFSQLELSSDDTMYIAQTDIKDYFYSIGLPVELRPYFALPPVDLQEIFPKNDKIFGNFGNQSCRVYPTLVVVPMGWNWAMFISQRIHQYQAMVAAQVGIERCLVDGRPSPNLDSGPVLIPYADNLNIIGTNKKEVQELKTTITQHLESIGFRVHEEQEALPHAESLGFYLDGVAGKIFPKPNKLEKVQKVLHWLSTRPRVSGKMIERIIGHTIHFCMLRRELLSVFRAMYDFKMHCYNKRQTLWSSAAIECKNMAYLLEMCFADLRRPWNQEVTCSDASLTGTAVCRATWASLHVKAAGQQRELWRFRATGTAGKARQHVQELDPFNDLDTVRPMSQDAFTTPFVIFQLNLEFKEISPELLSPTDWSTQFATNMKHPEHITLLEARGVIQSLRHKARTFSSFHSRHVHLGDNLGMILSFDRGRAKNKALLFQCRRSAALAVATDSEYHFRWIPSELNVADSPSRIFEPARHASKREQKRKIQEVLYPQDSKEGKRKDDLSDKPAQKGKSALCRVEQDFEASRDSSEDFRCFRTGEKSEEKGSYGITQCHSQKHESDFPRTVGSVSSNSSRLQSPHADVQHVLSTAQDKHHKVGTPGFIPDDIPAAVFQRWNGARRGHQVFGSSDRLISTCCATACTTSQPPCPKRMEKLGSRQVKTTHSMASHSADLPENDSTRTSNQCNVGSDHVCDILPSLRTPHHGQEGFGGVRRTWKKLGNQHQQVRRSRDIKDGPSGRDTDVGFKRSSVVGRGSKPFETKRPDQPSDVPSGVLRLSSPLEAGSAGDSVASRLGSSIPTSSFRGIVGQIQKVPKPTGGESPRSMASRFFHGEVRKTRLAESAVRISGKKCSKAELSSSRDIKTDGPKLFSPIASSVHVRHGLRNKVCLELFSGSSRVARRLAKVGFFAEAWDILFGDSCDTSNSKILDSILHRINRGDFICSHWSAM